MKADPNSADRALHPVEPGEVLQLGNEKLAVRVAPDAGGRIEQLSFEGEPWLCGYAPEFAATLQWGCYPMVPWSGRVRRGRFHFDGREHQLRPNFGAHAVHGVGFTLRWQVESQTATDITMSLQLPRDETWPFAGVARQRLTVAGRTLRMELSLSAGRYAMPRPVLGWHPWFLQPDRFDFSPTRQYPRDAERIAVLPAGKVAGRPWDDCFINTRAVVLHRGEQSLRLSSDCDHWVVFDEYEHALGVEPQSGPPDAFNLNPKDRLEPGETAEKWFLLEWLRQR
jgi:aldose 1-epimerase